MKNKTIKLLSIITILLATIVLTSNVVFAQPTIPSAKLDVTGASNLTSVGGMILGIATTIGMIVAVVILVVLAIKYMASSPNDKAEIKKHAVVWVVGAVLLFAASGVVKLVQGFGGTVGGELNKVSSTDIVKDINA